MLAPPPPALLALFTLLAALAASFGGCGKSDSGGSSAVSFNLSFVNSGAAPSGAGSSSKREAIDLSRAFLDPGVDPVLSSETGSRNIPVDANIGASSYSQISSLQLAIYGMSLCTGANGTGTCSQIYASGTYDSSAYAAGTVPSDTRWIDLMNPDSVKAALDEGSGITDTCTSTSTATVTSSSTDTSTATSVTQTTCVRNKPFLQPGTYLSGTLSAYSVIKIKAAVTLNDSAGTTLVTRNDLTYNDGSSGSTAGTSYYYSASIRGTEAQQATVPSKSGFSGGFTFTKPWTFGGESGMVLDLVFNADSYVVGTTKAYGHKIQGPVLGKDSNSYNVQDGLLFRSLDIAPVVHTKEQTIKKDVYVFKGPAANVRVELFYLSGDSSKTIYSLSTAALARSDTKNNISNPGINTMTVDGSKVTFSSLNGTYVIKDFTLLTTAGETGTATMNCGTGNSDSELNPLGTNGICGKTTIGDYSATYTFIGAYDLK